MATPDYQPPITPPPQPGPVNDLTGEGSGSSGSGGSGGSGGSSGSDPLYTGSPTPDPNQPYSPPSGGPATGMPTLELTPMYQPKDIPVPDVPDTVYKDPGYKPPPLPDMPEVDKTMTKAPEKTLSPMSNLIPGGDTTSINEDWQAIAAKAPGVTAEQTVQGQLEKLFNEGSPLLEYARGIGLQYANSRGLINSDIAGEAGAMALYNQAVPIAQADAQIFARRAEQEAAFWQNAGLQAQQANFQSRLQAQAHIETMRQQALQGDINARLQLEQFGYNWDLNEQQNIHRMELAAFEGKVQAKLNLQQLGIDVEKMRIDWAYRAQANDQEIRNALRLAKFEDDQMVERINQQHVANLREIETSGYQQRLADYANNQEAWRRQQASDEQAWRRQQDDQDFIRGENQADRDLDRERMDWEANQRDLDRQQRDSEIEQANKVNWQTQYANAVDNLGVQLTNEIMNIMNNGNMTASQQQYAARQAWDRYVKRFQTTSEFYKSSPLWDPAWTLPMIEFGDVYSGSSAGTTGGAGTSGSTPGGAGSQPSTPANPDGVSGGSTNGSLDGTDVATRNAWEASGYDYRGNDQSGQYQYAYSATGRLVVWHERTQQWVDPNHHQYRSDFPGLNIPGSSFSGSGGSSGGGSDGLGGSSEDNSEGSYRATGYSSPNTSLYTNTQLNNPLYSSNPLYSDRYFR